MDEQLRLLVLLLLFLAIPAVTTAVVLLRRVRERGGAVDASALGLPDVLVCFFLCGFFALLVLGHHPQQKAGAARELKPQQIVDNIVFFLGLLGLLAGFLRLRRIPPAAFFGLRRWPLGRVLLTGVLLLGSIYPLVHGLGQLLAVLLQEAAREQDVVKLYRDVAQSGNSGQLALMIFMAVIFQPVAEETLFRGYFYATFKGWAGPVASAVFTATLFAAIHLNLASFPSLLVLALGLTLAYEWSGSLLVPIVMHAAFNGVQLALFTWQNHHAS